MTPFDLETAETWTGTLERFAREARMTATLTDDDGKVLLNAGERYPLCVAIRSFPDALTFVCSQTSSAMLGVVRKTLRPEVDQCEIGLLRVAIPIVRDGQLVGQLTACGLAADDEEPDAFMAAQQLGISEDEAEALGRYTPVGSEAALRALAARLFAEVNPPGRGAARRAAALTPAGRGSAPAR